MPRIAKKRREAPVEDIMVSSPPLEERLGRLIAIVRQIDNAQGGDQLLKFARGHARQLIAHQVAFLARLNKARTFYVLHALSPVAEATELGHKHFGIEEGCIGHALAQRTSFCGSIDEAPGTHPAIEGRLKDFGVQSIMVVPMISGEDIVGGLLFGSTEMNAYTNDDVSIIELWGAHLGTGLKHLTLFEDGRKRLSQIELIYDVSRKLTSELELQEVLNAAAVAIQKSFRYFDVSVFLLDPENEQLILEAHSGNYEDFLPHGYQQSIHQGIIGWVAKHGEMILANDVSLDPRFMTYSYHNTKSELSLPIKVDGAVVGVLNVEDSALHAFDETDAMVLETLCDHLGIAIRNARLYSEVRTANMKLMELDKMKSEFVGVVSHDFRSPLSSIVLAAKSLLKHNTDRSDKRLTNYLHIIVEQAMRLSRLAEDTLSITKIEAGQLKFEYKIVNVERLIHDALSVVKLSKYHTVEFSVDQEALFIKADQSKLRQVLQNLLSNAVKYSPKGGNISITAKNHSDDKILISVADQGIGIPLAQRDKLFQKFARITSGEARDIKGTGLGLWICKEIVQAHGGTIWVDGQEGKGSVFSFTVKRVQ